MLVLEIGSQAAEVQDAVSHVAVASLRRVVGEDSAVWLPRAQAWGLRNGAMGYTGATAHNIGDFITATATTSTVPGGTVPDWVRTTVPFAAAGLGVAWVLGWL